MDGFADVDAIWQWDPPVSPSPSCLSLSFLVFSLCLLSFSSLLYRQQPTIPMIAAEAAFNLGFPGSDLVARRPPLPFP
jgi:hypothetical protein